MTRTRKIIFGVAVAIVVVAGWIAFRIYHTAAGLRDAYAAWDSGTLVIEYMKRNQNHWPKSWDELVNIVRDDGPREIVLYGSQAGNIAYAQSLRKRVQIDWSYDPSHSASQGPFTKSDGSKFDVVWSGANPNDMIRAYLADHPATLPAAAR